jgi:hypothetical protein
MCEAFSLNRPGAATYATCHSMRNAARTFRSSLRPLAPQNLFYRNAIGACASAVAEGWSLENRFSAWHIDGMRQVLSNIEAGKLSDELQRRGIPSTQRLDVVVESVAEDLVPITRINEAGRAFEWLKEEPDLYSDADLVERYRE